MRRRFLMTLLFTLLWSAVVIAMVLAEAFWFARPAARRGDARAIAQHLVRQLGDAAADQRLGSAALVLVEDGQVVAEHGFGVANAETQSRVVPQRTLYQVASVSKLVTAWGVMKLVQDGRLGLDEPVLRYLKRWRFPGSPAFREKVTVRHLLSHTAGLDDGFGYGGFLPGEAIPTLEESLTLTRDSTVGKPRAVTVSREPGTAMAYSGGGYTVLQLLIEEVTGQRFADYMKEAVLQPLGMTNADFDLERIEAEGRAQDLATAFDHEVNPKPRRRHVALAAVALYATPRDLARLAQAFRGNRVLSEDTLRQMMLPQQGTSGTWGLGTTLFVANDAGGHVVGHDGGSPPAWGAMLRVNPATGNAMVLTISGGRGAANRLGHDWVQWETGTLTAAGRRQIAFSRLPWAAAAIVLGALAFLLLYRPR